MKTILLILITVPISVKMVGSFILGGISVLAWQWICSISAKIDEQVFEEKCCFVKTFLDKIESSKVSKREVIEFVREALDCPPEAFRQFEVRYPKCTELLEKMAKIVEEYTSTIIQQEFVSTDPLNLGDATMMRDQRFFEEQRANRIAARQSLETLIMESLPSMGITILAEEIVQL